MVRLALLLTISLLTLASPAGAGACVAVQLLDDRCERWAHVFDGHTGGSVAGGDIPAGIATSSDGEDVYLLVTTKTPATDDDATVVALRGTDGTLGWRFTYASDGRVADSATDLTLSEDGGTLFVTLLTESDEKVATAIVALDAVSGETRWTRVVDVEGATRTVLHSPVAQGGMLYLGGSVAGTSTEPGGSQDVDGLVLALDAATGGFVWQAREEGLLTGSDVVVALAVPPTGDRVVVQLASRARAESTLDLDFLTIAYEARDEDRLGEALWKARFDAGAAAPDIPVDLVLSPDGDTAYVAGSSIAAGSADNDYDLTVRSYRLADGAVGFTARYDGPMTGFDIASDLDITEDGRTLVTTGLSARLPQTIGAGSTTLGAWAGTGSGDIAVVAHDAATGAQRWVHRYEPAGFLYTGPVALTIAAERAYVTGFSYSGVLRSDVATLAIELEDGTGSWVARYNSSDSGKDFDQPMAMTSAGGRVFVAARLAYNASVPGANSVDAGVLAYDA